jgi:hypothetical protein
VITDAREVVAALGPGGQVFVVSGAIRRCATSRLARRSRNHIAVGMEYGQRGRVVAILGATRRAESQRELPGDQGNRSSAQAAARESIVSGSGFPAGRARGRRHVGPEPELVTSSSALAAWFIGNGRSKAPICVRTPYLSPILPWAGRLGNDAVALPLHDGMRALKAAVVFRDASYANLSAAVGRACVTPISGDISGSVEVSAIDPVRVTCFAF